MGLLLALGRAAAALLLLTALSLLGSLLAARFKRAALSDAAFKLALLCAGPLTVALHLTSPYYGLAPATWEAAFHRWRVRRYFGRGSHSRSRAAEAAQSGRPYRAEPLPTPGQLVRWDFRPGSAAPKPGGGAAVRVVTWNLEFGYLLGPLIAELRLLQPDIICLQEVDRYDDGSVSVDVGREIAEALQLCGVWCAHHRYEHGGWGCAILSRFDLTSATFLELPHLDGYPRGAVMAAVSRTNILGSGPALLR